MYTAIIADDEKLICNAIQSVLDTAIPELKILNIFHDGSEVYDYLTCNKADILLLDIQMPKKSGLDIAELVRSLESESYIIIITAYQDFNYAKKAIDCNVNAFLTKPFTSGQLIDAVRKGISLFEQKNATTANKLQTNRRFLQALCFDSTKTLYDGIRMCNDSILIEELLCTEVIIKDDYVCSLSQDALLTMQQTIRRNAENDTEKQSSFLMECNDNSVKILVFSQNEPDLNFIASTLKIISFHTNNTPTYTVKTYSSFVEYRSYLYFSKEMDQFFQLTVDSTLNQAKKYISRYIKTLSTNELNNFKEFLKEFYQLNIMDTDVDAIIKSLDTLINRSFSIQSGNFIINSACEYIHNNYSSSSISLESVANTLSVSSVYLSRAFKKFMKQNFSEYLLNVRMEHAKQLLQSTYLSTTEVAASVGYENTAYFRASFKSYFSMTPKQYRLIANRKDNKI